MNITITTKKNVANGIDLKNLLAQITAQYLDDDGIGAYSLPTEVKFGVDATGKRVSAKHPNAVTVIDIGW